MHHREVRQCGEERNLNSQPESHVSEVWQLHWLMSERERKRESLAEEDRSKSRKAVRDVCSIWIRVGNYGLT